MSPLFEQVKVRNIFYIFIPLHLIWTVSFTGTSEIIITRENENLIN